MTNTERRGTSNGKAGDFIGSSRAAERLMISCKGDTTGDSLRSR
jgi:hypothetical protein